jgi:STE24 endopeptidase
VYRFLKWFVIVFLLYSVFISWYLLYGAGAEIPSKYAGTAADPSVFMDDRQIELSYDFSRLKHILFFISIPLEWLMYIGLLGLGFSKRFRNWAGNVTKIGWLQAAIYVFWFSIITTLFMFPVQWISYMISKKYGIAASTFSVWMKDFFIDFWLGYFMLVLMTIVIYALIRKSTKRWWLYVWLLTVPFTLFLMFVKPVIIDPLYNDFYPLKDKQLEEKILDVAHQADIPANHVYEVNMSEKTNALNAYVTGIGSNSRIVLWDTTLNKLNDEEVIFIMAHEIAHYVKKHVYIGVIGYLLISLLGFYLTAKILNYVVQRYGKQLQIRGIADVASLPLILLIFSVLSFAASPFSNAVSRYQEHSADRYAIEMTNNPEAAVSTFQQLTISGLSEVNPPAIVKWFRYGHPTMVERIHYLENFKKEE